MRLSNSLSRRSTSTESTLVGSIYEKPNSTLHPSPHQQQRERSWVASFLRRLFPSSSPSCHTALEIGEPTGFQHRVHVGWDTETNGFTGLPQEWKQAFEAPQIGSPYGFEHRVHVGYDPEVGGYTGLPEEWRIALMEQERL